MNLTAMLHAAANSRPKAIATIFQGRENTWENLRERVSRLASARSGFGVQPGDRVAILALNSDLYTEYLFAVWWIGAVAVPMNTRWVAQESAYCINDSETVVLFIDEAFLSQLHEIRSLATSLKHVVFMGQANDAAQETPYEELIDKQSPCEDGNFSGEHLAGIYYTGGTTGFPKGVMLSHRALWYNYLTCTRYLDISPEDRFLHTAPMFHLADGAAGGAALMAGASHTYLPAFSPAGLMDIVDRLEVTHTVIVPTMVAMLLQSPDFTSSRVSSLRRILYGSSPMPEGVLTDALKKLPTTDFMQGYGQTELAPIISILTPDYHQLEGNKSGKLRSAGRPALGCEVKIVRDTGAAARPGEVGEIVVRSPGMMTGYWRREKETAEVMQNGWIFTGDGGYVDDDGFIFIVDRLKDMIVSGGENVFSAEVESVLSTHPAIAEVAVIGIPSESWGEEVHAIVVARDSAAISDEELTRYCKARMAGYKCPRSFTLRQEPLPLSGAGKVLKKILREPFWKGYARSVG